MGCDFALCDSCIWVGINVLRSDPCFEPFLPLTLPCHACLTAFARLNGRSQIKVLSAEPDTMRVPSGEYATALTSPECPLPVASGPAPTSLASQIMMVLSPEQIGRAHV